MADQSTANIQQEDDGKAEDLDQLFGALPNTPAEKDDSETENSEAPPAEPKPDEKPPSQGGGESTPDDDSIPLHKHPRWVAREEAHKDDIRRRDEKLAAQEREIAALNEFKARADQRFQEMDRVGSHVPVGTTDIPGWFAEAFGDNQELHKKFLAYSAGERQRIKEEVLGEIHRQEEQEQESLRKTEEWVNAQVDGLTREGKQFDRNAFMLYAREHPIFTTDGTQLDFRRIYDLFEKEQRLSGEEEHRKTEAKKKTAVATTSTPGGEQKPKQHYTSKDVRNKSWRELMPV